MEKIPLAKKTSFIWSAIGTAITSKLNKNYVLFRESARSSESNECPLKSLSFGLLEKSTSSLENRGHSSLNPYHRDTDEPPLVIEDQKSGVNFKIINLWAIFVLVDLRWHIA